MLFFKLCYTLAFEKESFSQKKQTQILLVRINFIFRFLVRLYQKKWQRFEFLKERSRFSFLFKISAYFLCFLLDLHKFYAWFYRCGCSSLLWWIRCYDFFYLVNVFLRLFSWLLHMSNSLRSRSFDFFSIF